jgi:hypothetical protein
MGEFQAGNFPFSRTPAGTEKELQERGVAIIFHNAIIINRIQQIVSGNASHSHNGYP